MDQSFSRFTQTESYIRRDKVELDSSPGPGAMLFILYINDLPETITNKNSIYADDTKILGKIRSDHVQEDLSSLQNDIDTTVKWTDKMLLRLNPEKCKVIQEKSNKRILHE